MAEARTMGLSEKLDRQFESMTDEDADYHSSYDHDEFSGEENERNMIRNNAASEGSLDEHMDVDEDSHS